MAFCRTVGFRDSKENTMSNTAVLSLAARRKGHSPVDGSTQLRASGFAATNASIIGTDCNS